MKARYATLLMSSAVALTVAGAAHAANRIPMNQSEQVRGVPVACAGVGNQSQDNARWNNYAVKLDFVTQDGAYLGNEHVRIRDNNGRMLNVRCHAPWVLMDLNPGRYSAEATLPDGQSKRVNFTVGRNAGQKRVLVHFAREGNQQMQNAGYRENGEPYNQGGQVEWQDERMNNGGMNNGANGQYQNGQYRNGQYENGYNNTGYNNTGYNNRTNGNGYNNGQYENGYNNGYNNAGYNNRANGNGYNNGPYNNGQYNNGQNANGANGWNGYYSGGH